MATKVTLNLKRGKTPGREHVIYATLNNAKGSVGVSEVCVSADLEYCLEALKDPDNDYELVNGVEALETLNTILRGMK